MTRDLEFAIKQDIRNNPVVREIDLAQKRDFLRVLAWAGGMLIMLIIALAPRVQAIQGGYAMQKLRNDVEVERELHRRLLLEWQTETRPDTIETRARAIGLVDPTEADTMVIEVVPPSASADRAIVATNR